MNSTVTEGMVAESVGQRGDGGCGADVGGDGHRHISRAADDLLACGCILAEICAGEPVLSGFTVMANSPGATRRRNSDAEIDSGVGAGGWLDSAMYLPTALRGAIGALTHVDPSKVSGCRFREADSDGALPRSVLFRWPHVCVYSYSRAVSNRFLFHA